MIGRLNSEITLLSESALADGGGGNQIAWTAGATIWADIEELSSSSNIAGDRNVRLRRIAARIRQRSGLTLGGRIRLVDTDFDITSIEDDDDGRIALICEEALS
ncbi:MAG: head-tail adaptor protein [Pseudomonadota bacterium]